MFEDLRREAYGEPRRSKYEGVPEMTRAEKEAFDKDTDAGLWKQSVKFTNSLFNGATRRLK